MAYVPRPNHLIRRDRESIEYATKQLRRKDLSPLRRQQFELSIKRCQARLDNDEAEFRRSLGDA